MKSFINFLIIFSIFLYPIIVRSQGAISAKQEQWLKHWNLGFIENKGQVRDQYGNARTDIQYKVSASAGLNVFIGNGSLHYQFSKPQNDTSINPHDIIKNSCEEVAPKQYDMYRMDVILEGANQHAKIIADDKQGNYENYHTAYLNSRDIPVNSFGRITYKNIYPDIDWVLYINDNHLEYDFVVRPGGNVQDIKIRYDGATELKENNGTITAATLMGTVSEGLLYSYKKQGGKEIASSFVLREKTIGFDVKKYNGTIVIDPTLLWATYYGGGANDEARHVACDVSGNVYIAGVTASISCIATTGTYQSTYGGGLEDAFLTKFNSIGVLLWSTYYGGSGSDLAWGVACDGADNIFMSGTTESTDSIATTGSYQSTYGGNGDVFLAKFNSAGVLIWATYFGGSGGENTRYLACDGSGNAYISGSTTSLDSIATAGAYQVSFGGGIADAFLAKFNSGGALQWATYYGGSGLEEAYGVACFDTGSVYITGYTKSTSSIATPGAHQTGGGGSKRDAFLAKFNNKGSLLWGTYYGGSGDDVAYSVACDNSGNAYITGMPGSFDSIATPGAYATTGGGGGFLAKFESSGLLQWGTYLYGTGYDVACDLHANVCVTGYTNALDSIATSDGYKLHYNGGIGMNADDAYIEKFSGSGAILWGSYFGGSGTEWGYGVTCDYKGNMFICGLTQSNDSISTTGCYQYAFGGGYQDGFLAKFGDLPTTIQQVNSTKDINFYPNPAKDYLYLNYENINNGQLVITDIFGREVIVKRLDREKGNEVIDIHGLSTGVYLYKVFDNGSVIKTGEIMKE